MPSVPARQRLLAATAFLLLTLGCSFAAAAGDARLELDDGVLISVPRTTPSLGETLSSMRADTFADLDNATGLYTVALGPFVDSAGEPLASAPVTLQAGDINITASTGADGMAEFTVTELELSTIQAQGLDIQFQGYTFSELTI